MRLKPGRILLFQHIFEILSVSSTVDQLIIEEADQLIWIEDKPCINSWDRAFFWWRRWASDAGIKSDFMSLYNGLLCFTLISHQTY